MLIGICGLIGSGKDTVAERLVNEHGYKRDSFAKSLKDAVASMFNWDRDMLEGRGESSRHWREQPDKFWSERFGREVSPRTILQQFGTEVMRGQMYDGIWVDSCIGRYKGENTVISDTRFPNEIKRIKEATKLGNKIGLEVHAGHGLTYKSTKILSKISGIKEFNIGHFLVGESIFSGLGNTIKRFKKLII